MKIDDAREQGACVSGTGWVRGADSRTLVLMGLFTFCS